MADVTTAPTPVAPAAAPTPAPAAVPGSTAPTTTALPANTVQQPAQPPVNSAPIVQAQIAPFENAANTATAKATQLAGQGNQPQPPQKHARLLSMIQGLSLGLGSFGTAIATHGREGGVQEVAAVNAERQQQRLEAQRAATEQLNQRIQQQIQIGDTNRQTAQNIILLSTLPTDLQLKDLALTNAQTQAAAGRAALAGTSAEFMTQFGVSPDEFEGMISGTSKPTPQASQNFRQFATQKVNAAGQILKSNDPTIVQAKQVLADPNSTPQQLFGAVAGTTRAINLQKQVSDIKSQQDTARKNSIVGQLSTPENLAAPGSVASIRAAIADPSTDPNDVPRLQALIPQAIVAQNRALQIKKQEKEAEQTVTQGNPDTAGQLLADGTLTLEELKSRGATPQFIASSVASAKKFDPKFDAPTAAAQAKIAGSEANQQFFGATDSLLVKGGTLDQLQTSLDALGNTQIKPYNTYANLVKDAAGGGAQGAASAKILGVVDDLAKVIGGGVGTDASRKSAMDVINRSLAPGQSNQVVSAVRGVVESQRNGRIGVNRYMKKMYPDPSTLSEVPGFSGTQSSGAPAAANGGGSFFGPETVPTR